MAIYARENGQGMMFAQSKGQTEEDTSGKDTPSGPHLKLIK
jgi:stringent starvation protein B